MNHGAMLVPTIDEIGGAESQVLLLAVELTRRGWRISVIALSGSGGTASARLSIAGVDYVSLRMRRGWFDPRGWVRYLDWAASNQPSVVHSHLPHATWFARWVRPLSPVRVVIDTIHTSNTGPIGRRLGYRLSDWLSDRVTCVSESVANAATSAKMVSHDKLIILPNGVRLPPSIPNRRDEEHSPFLWIAVGRLAPVKDYPTLFRAFATLRGSPRLVIAGAGPEEIALRDLAVNLGIEERVEFAGYRLDIHSLLVKADAFVLSSLWEGLPVSVLEAQAAGLPVVATDAAGTREAVLAGQSGLLVPVGGSAALSSAMNQIMDSPREMRRSMGDCGKQFIQQRFSLAAVADRWEALYLELLKANPRPARWAKPSRKSN
jgi:glycosyltransferase involved in cell wall biosynthesis